MNTSSKKELIEKLYNKIDKESEGTWRYEVFEKHLQELPQQEVEIKDNDNPYPLCNNCSNALEKLYNYCPYCGNKIKRID